MDKNYDPLLHSQDYDSWMDMQGDVLEWWYDMYDCYEAIPLWENGCPEYNASYGQREPSLIIVPYSETVPPKGVVLVSAGGGFAYKSHHEGVCVAERFSKAGYIGAVLDYRVLPYTQYDCIKDVNRAVKLLKSLSSKYGYPKDNIALLGFSAGGQVSLLGGVHYDLGHKESADSIETYSSRPGAVISCYSALNFVDFPDDTALDTCLGTTSSMADREYLTASHHLDAETPPVFIWASRQDALVNAKHSLNLASALLTAGVPFELHMYDDGGHGCGLCDDTNIEKQFSGPHIATWVPLCIEWLDSKFAK